MEKDKEKKVKKDAEHNLEAMSACKAEKNEKDSATRNNMDPDTNNVNASPSKNEVKGNSLLGKKRREEEEEE